MTPRPGSGGLVAGIVCRCPRCGVGPLFAGFLKVTPVCVSCGYPLGASESGDGPAVFVIMIVGFLTVFGALFTEVAVHPPVWVHLVIWLPLATALCLVLLRPVKGLMIAAQIRNKAAEHRRDGV
ncbi:MAG: DUF983 domain-containing protein [Caulobacteraceae bacterium]